ncbi:MAG: hypothetical protein O4805_01600 [Trichodesmium sp. St16_bin2-tuft]|nr:hypothetical protein [Trichodesmium sp. St18_bin1]MDE5085906.1 hypothetical protein [Trichodesmium sp. St16_bin2-tuft]
MGNYIAEKFSDRLGLGRSIVTPYTVSWRKSCQIPINRFMNEII